MPKFFIQNGNISDGFFVIKDDDFSHIKHVLRKNTGDTLTVCDGSGTDFECVISEIGDNCLKARIMGKVPAGGEPSLSCTLFQAIPKGEKMDVIVQKSVELGVFQIVPVITSRCVVKLDDASKRKKVERWQKISKEAAKQCGRGIVPEILPVCDLTTAVGLMDDYEHKIILYEGEKDTSLHDILTANMRQMAYFIGPEGGFETREADLCVKNGVIPVSLGNRILRTETASACLLSVAMFSTYNL